MSRAGADRARPPRASKPSRRPRAPGGSTRAGRPAGRPVREGRAAGPATEAAGTGAPSGPERVGLSADGLVLGGREVPFLSGEVHYFRHDPSDWPRLLDAAVELGLPLVSTYVPWAVHEVEPGRFDFGETGPARDLDRFLDLAAERSLVVALRPGPHVNAELTWFGFPFRVLRDPRAMARTPGGAPVWLPLFPRLLPIPSYASSFFLEEACRWLVAFGERLGARAFPAGPVAVVQLDNEAPLLVRDGPFDQDYSAGSLALHAEFLAARGRPAAEPPRRFEARSAADLQPYLDWIEFRPWVFARALARMRRALEGAGLGSVVFSHNLVQGGPVPPVWPGELPAADLVGFDFYQQRRLLAAVRARCLYAAGTTALPFAAELGTGGPWNLPPLRGRDTETLARAAVAYGLRGANLFMAADRDRWYGAPIERRGRGAPGAGRARRAVAAFRAVAAERLRLRARVAVVVPRLYSRLSQATWAGGPLLPPSLEALGPAPVLGCREDRLGFEAPIQIAWHQALERVTRALSRRGLGHVLVDSEAVPARLEGFEAAVVPTFELLDAGLWERLLARVGLGLELALGPRTPAVAPGGARLEPSLALALGERLPFGRGGLVLLDLSTDRGAEELAARLARAPGELSSPLRPAEDGVDVSVLEAGGLPRLVGVAELEGRARRPARLEADPAIVALVDEDDGGRLEPEGGAVELRLEPFEVRLLRLEVG